MASLLGDPILLVLAVQFALLLGLARFLGFVARRRGLPPIVGEITAGVLLGPSLLGTTLPALEDWLFPAGEVETAALRTIAWLGAVLLVATAGADIDVPLSARLVRRLPWVPVLGALLPLAAGAALGWVLPAAFLGPEVDRALFAGFLGVTFTISALPVVTRVLHDLGLARRDVGQLTVAAASIDDLVGWVLLGLLASVAGGSGVGPGAFGIGLLAAVLFLVVAATLGQRLVDLALRASYLLTETVTGPLTVTVVVVLTGTAIAQALGLDGVFGALVAGVVVGRSPLQRPEVQRLLRAVAYGVFGPVFFATVGLSLDLRGLGTGSALAWALVLFVVASVAKVGGGWLGARLGGADPLVGAAVGVGINARGGLGVVAATVALGVGVFSDIAFTAVVLVAVLTSLGTPTVLRRLAEHLPRDDEEEQRLARETLLRDSLVVTARRVLLPTRGGGNSRVAARIVDLSLDAAAAVTVMSVAEGGDHDRAAEVSGGVAGLFGHRRVEQRVRPEQDPATAILDELRHGYDLLVVGASQDVRGPHQLSDVLQRLLTAARVPLLLVRSRTDVEGLAFRRILTAADGTSVGRAAEDVAFALGARSGAEVDVVHVISRVDRILLAAWLGNADEQPVARTLLGRSLTRARALGATARTATRVGGSTAEQLLAAAGEQRADVIVVATQVRDLDGRPFLGHGVEFLLEHAEQTLVVVVLPDGAGMHELD